VSDHQNPLVDNTETELALLEETMRSLPVPARAAEIISDGLNFLYDNGADDQAEVLEDIHRAASAMLQTTQQINQGFGAALHIAKALREQARRTLADLKEAIETCDTDVPEIEGLAEMLREEQDEMLWYTLDDILLDQITCNTPLDYREGNHLLAVLEGGDLDSDHYLWDELRDWIRRAQMTIDTCICPEPAAN